MNSLTIDPGAALYLPGGTIHSLGSGLYFEVLADGDLRVTLQGSFAGKALSMKDRLGMLDTGNEDDLLHALEFIDYEAHGPSVIDACYRRPVAVDRCRSTIVHSPYFEAEWIQVPPGEEYSIDNVTDRKPRVIVAVTGEAVVEASRNRARAKTRPGIVRIGAGAGSFDDFTRGGSCIGGIVHHATDSCTLKNSGAGPFVALHVSEPTLDAE